MKKQKQIEVILENCEVYSFNEDDCELLFNGLSLRWSRGKVRYFVDNTILRIKKSAKAESEWRTEDWKYRLTRCGDIVSIQFKGKDYLVRYSGDWDNRFQKSEEDDKDIVIIISEKWQSWKDWDFYED